MDVMAASATESAAPRDTGFDSVLHRNQVLETELKQVLDHLELGYPEADDPLMLVATLHSVLGRIDAVV